MSYEPKYIYALYDADNEEIDLRTMTPHEAEIDNRAHLENEEGLHWVKRSGVIQDGPPPEPPPVFMTGAQMKEELRKIWR